MTDANRIFVTGASAARSQFDPQGSVPSGFQILFWEEDTKDLLLWTAACGWTSVDLEANPPEPVDGSHKPSAEASAFALVGGGALRTLKGGVIKAAGAADE